MNEFIIPYDIKDDLKDDRRIPFVDINLFRRCYDYLSTNYPNMDWIFSIKDHYFKKDYPTHTSTYYHLLISNNGSIARLFYREISDGKKGLFGETNENLSNPEKFKEIIENHIYISNSTNILEEGNFFFNFLRFSIKNNPGYLKFLTLSKLQSFLNDYQNERIKEIEIKILEPYSKEDKEDRKKLEIKEHKSNSFSIFSKLYFWKG